MTRIFSTVLLAASLGACKAEDPTGTWTGTAQTSILGERTSYELDIDLQRDEGKNLFGEGILLIGGKPTDITVQGDQKRRKIEFELLPVDVEGLDTFLKTEFIKGKMDGDSIDGKLAIGVSLAKVKGDMLLRRQ